MPLRPFNHSGLGHVLHATEPLRPWTYSAQRGSSPSHGHPCGPARRPDELSRTEHLPPSPQVRLDFGFLRKIPGALQPESNWPKPVNFGQSCEFARAPNYFSALRAASDSNSSRPIPGWPPLIGLGARLALAAPSFVKQFPAMADFSDFALCKMVRAVLNPRSVLAAMGANACQNRQNRQGRVALQELLVLLSCCVRSLLQQGPLGTRPEAGLELKNELDRCSTASALRSAPRGTGSATTRSRSSSHV